MPLELEAARQQLGTNFDVETFVDGAMLLERAMNGALPDVVVLDWHMDGVSGLDVLRFLRSQASTVGLPILVFTATGNREDLIDALEAGADDYVGKGAPAAEVNARVSTLIRANTLRARAERAEAELAHLLVSERSARAEAEAANREKDQFLAMVSHELRTPLSAILGWARMLKTGSLDATQTARAVETIVRNAVDQARLVDDLFDVARIVSGGIRLDVAPFDLSRAIENAIDASRPSASAKRMRLVVDLTPCFVSGDVARLQQVALNLLSNAVKFTPAGGTVTIALRSDGKNATLTVSDTGPGISPALLTQVFDRFRQGDHSITREHGGLGLGLSIVRQIVEMHGGTVVARNGPDGGAAFDVVLPALPAEAAPVEAPVLDALPGSRLQSIRVLLTGDDADARSSLLGVLGGCGAVVIEAVSASAAMDALGKEPPDVVVLAVATAVPEGYALVREVRHVFGHGVPAIVVGAPPGHEDTAVAAGAGFQLHFARPLDTEELVRAISSLTAGRDST